MRELRGELDIGVVTGLALAAKGLEAKSRIGELLGIQINCVQQMKRRIGAPMRG